MLGLSLFNKQEVIFMFPLSDLSNAITESESMTLISGVSQPVLKNEIESKTINYFNNNPHECSRHIASYLNLIDLRHFRQVSKEFRTITYSNDFFKELFENSKFYKLCSNNGNQVGSNDIKQLSQCIKNIGKGVFSLKDVFFDENMSELAQAFSNFTSLTSLEVLGIYPTYVSKILDDISKLPTLKSLRIGVNNLGLKSMSKLTSLTFLDLTLSSWITSEGIQELKDLNNLTCLNLRGCWRIDSNGINFISKTFKLKKLGIEYCKEAVTDDSMAYFPSMNTLTHLDSYECRISDMGVNYISTLANLTVLEMGLPYHHKMNNQDYKGITIEAISKLCRLKNLISLGLSSRNLSDKALKNISTLSLLTELDISNCDLISNAGLHHLSNLRSLKVLNLSSCTNISNEGMSNLSEHKNLTSLLANNLPRITAEAFTSFFKLTKLTIFNLDHLKIKDEGVKLISRLSNITSLSLYGCSITDKGVMELAGKTKLTELDLRGNQVTSNGLKVLSCLKYLHKLDY